MKIRYVDSLATITQDQLDSGFFVGWYRVPTPETHLKILDGSYAIWLAVDEETGKVVGFINAISDGFFASFIPLLEVVPQYQGQGIGAELTRRMLDTLKDHYSIDLMADTDVQPFYEKMGMLRATGMLKRNYQFPKNET